MNPDGTISDDKEYDDDVDYSDEWIEKMQADHEKHTENTYRSLRLKALVGFDDPEEELDFMEAELFVAECAACRADDWSEHAELEAEFERRTPELYARRAEKWEAKRAARAAEAAAAGVQGLGGVNVGALMAALGKR